MAPPMWPAVASGCVFYYRDLDAAVRFYTEQLGLLVVMGRSDERGQQHHNGANGLVNDDDDDDGLYVHLQISSTSFLTLADGSSPRSNHSAGEPKATAMALLTDDLEAWDAHAAQRGLPFRGGKRLRRNAPGSAHDGFIILDPEGYKLEFEQFLPHAENNERLLPAIERCPHMPTTLPGPPKRLRASVNWLYYRQPAAARSFHEGALGMPLVCVQPGVADIYQTSPSGFFGAVDERAGMSDWAAPAAVMLSFVTHTAHRTHAALLSAVRLSDSKASADGSSETTPHGQNMTVAAVDESDPRFHAFEACDIEGYSFEWFELIPSAVTASRL